MGSGQGGSATPLARKEEQGVEVAGSSSTRNGIRPVQKVMSRERCETKGAATGGAIALVHLPVLLPQGRPGATRVQE